MYADDTFPLFFLRLVHYACCFFYHAPSILWMLFYVEYYAVSIRLDEPKRSLMLITSWLSLFIDQLTRYFRVTSTIPLGFGRFIEQVDIFAVFFLLSSPLHIQSLLPCVDTGILCVVSKEERDRVISLLSAWVGYASYQQNNQKLSETRPSPARAGSRGEPSHLTFARQLVQVARQVNEVQPKPSTRLLPVGAYPTGSDTEESELLTDAIEQGANMPTQPAQSVVGEDELSDELPPNIESALDEGTGEIVARFKNDEEMPMQEQITAEAGFQVPPTSPIHEPANTRYLTDQEAATSDTSLNRHGRVADTGTKLSSVKTICPRCHLVLEEGVEHPGSDNNNALENNMMHLTTDDASMSDDGDSRRRTELNYAGDEILDNSLNPSINSWMKQVSGIARPGLSGSVRSRDGMRSSATSTSDIEMGGIENPPETIQDGPLEPQSSLYSGMPSSPDTDGLPACFNLPSGSNFFSPTPSALRVYTSANIGARSSTISIGSPTQVGLVYSEGTAEALSWDVLTTSLAEATSTRGTSTLRRVPRAVLPLERGTSLSLKRSRSEDDDFMRKLESPLATKRCRRLSPKRDSARANGRQGGRRRLFSAARRLTLWRPRDLQNSRDPTTGGIEANNISNIQADNDIVMQSDDMQRDTAVTDSPLSDLESYTSPVSAAAEADSLPNAEMQFEVGVQGVSGFQRETGVNMQSDGIRILAEIDSVNLLNMPEDTCVTLHEDIGVQGSPLSDLESYASPVLAAVEQDSTPNAEVAAEVDMQEDADTQKESIRDIQSDVARLLAEIDSDYVLNMPADTEFEIREDEGVMSDPLYDLQGSMGTVLAEIETTSLSDTKWGINTFIQGELVVDNGKANRESHDTNTTDGAAVLNKGKGKGNVIANLEAESESDISAEWDWGELARQTDRKEWRKLTKGGIPRASPARRMGALKPVRASRQTIPTSMFTQGLPVASSSTADAAAFSSSTAVAPSEPMARLLPTSQTSAGKKASSSSGVRKPGIWGRLKDAVKERKPSMHQKRRKAERAATESVVKSPSEANDNTGNVGSPSESSSGLNNKENEQ